MPCLLAAIKPLINMELRSLDFSGKHIMRWRSEFFLDQMKILVHFMISPFPPDVSDAQLLKLTAITTKKHREETCA